MKEKVKCPYGHFYNGTLFDSCPHCADGMPEEKTEHIWGAGSSASAKEEKQAVSKPKSEYTEHIWGGASAKEEKQPTSKHKQGLSIWKKKEKVIAKEMRAAEVKAEKNEMFRCGEEEQAPVRKDYGFEAQAKNIQTPSSAPVQDNRSSLQEGLTQATRPVENLDDGKTVGYFHTSGQEEPPVGYLICTAGDDYGKGFLLKSGNNNVGRASSMDVIIMDAKVSREKQLSVIYEPHKREFFVKPGDGSSLSYYNDELLLGVQKLQGYDVLTIGDTKLMLVPVCSEKFSWDT